MSDKIEERKTPKQIIESLWKDVEHALIKAPRGELTDITKEGHPYSADSNGIKEAKFYRERGGKRHLYLHTHPNLHSYSALPSPEDLEDFDRNRDKRKTEVIAQRDEKTGEVQGYTFLFDKRGNKEYNAGQSWNLSQALKKEADKLKSQSPKGYYDGLLEIGREHEFDMRFHPEKGYYFNKGIGSYEKKLEHSLEGAVASIIIGFILLFLLIKIPFTGFIIASSVSANYGTGLFLISGLFFSLIVYFILRKSLKKN